MGAEAVTLLGLNFSGTEWVGIALVVLVIVTAIWFVATHRRR